METDWPVCFEFLLTVINFLEKHISKDMEVVHCTIGYAKTLVGCDTLMVLWHDWSTGKAPWGAGKQNLGKTEARERPREARESRTLEKLERGKGSLGRGKAEPWKNCSAGKAPWSAGKQNLVKNGVRESHPVWAFKSINRDGVGRAVVEVSRACPW